ncbi:MAG: sulfite exporter TauE/SafE family protein [Bacteroidaceae bacterium]|nr:sulfite exporter TauE/SafE family protein [Bacteroidaceae bacterium]
MLLSIEEIINEMMQSADLPLLTAFLLGLVVALNPCQLAINISALTYLAEDDTHQYHFLVRGVLYSLGRMMSYTLLGWVLMFVVSSGMKIDGLQHVLSKAEDFIPYVLIVFALFFLYRAFHQHHHHDSCHHSKQIIQANGKFGAFALGLLLAFAFCPESAVFFFGMMLPLSISSPLGWLVPLFFSIAAIIPVLVIVYFIRLTMVSSARRFEHKMEMFQTIVNIVSAIVFMMSAIWIFVA